MAARSGESVGEQLALLGVNYRTYPVQRNGLNPAKDIHTFFALFNALGELQPDVVLAYTIKPVIWGGIALIRKPNIRFFALITGLGFSFQESRSFIRRSLTLLVTWLYRMSLSRASRVIFQNSDNRDFFIEREIINKDKCSLVNGSGVDLDRFSVKSLPRWNNKTVFLTIGRLLGEKGFREYADAARLVKERYPETIFRIVGPEDPSPDGIPLSEIKDWEARGWIEYLGETKDVRPFISDCHIFVLPSYHEGMPRTVLEAMAMGRPILTTDVPGCRDTVVLGQNGYLIPKCNSIALAERMQWFIEHQQEWEKMGANSRKLAEMRYDVHKVNHEILKIMGLLQ